jgi:hypothetical protein
MAVLAEAGPDPEAYRRAIEIARKMEKGLEGVTDDVVDDILAALTQAQKATVARLAQVSQTWAQAQQQAVLAELTQQMLWWQQVAEQGMQKALELAHEVGGSLPPSMLSAILGTSNVGLSVRPTISRAYLAAAMEHSAVLIRDVGTDVIRAVDMGMRLAALAQKTPYDLIRELGSVTGRGKWASAMHRAEAIVRTEVGRVAQTATQASMQACAEKVPGLQKEWVTAGDDRVRPHHRAAAGQRVPVDKPFRVGGYEMLYPHDPRAPASETVHCRCRSLPWHPDWEDAAEKAKAEKPQEDLTDPAQFTERVNQDDIVRMNRDAVDGMYRELARLEPKLAKAWEEWRAEHGGPAWAQLLGLPAGKKITGTTLGQRVWHALMDPSAHALRVQKVRELLAHINYNILVSGEEMCRIAQKEAVARLMRTMTLAQRVQLLQALEKAGMATLGVEDYRPIQERIAEKRPSSSSVYRKEWDALLKIARQLEESEVGFSSAWNGALTHTTPNNALGVFNWDGSIGLSLDLQRYSPIYGPAWRLQVQLHELLHSISRALPRHYAENRGLEEGLVEALSHDLLPEIAPNLGVSAEETKGTRWTYTGYVTALERIRRALGSPPRREFYTNLVRMPLSEREAYLTAEANKLGRTAAAEVAEALDMLQMEPRLADRYADPGMLWEAMRTGMIGSAKDMRREPTLTELRERLAEVERQITVLSEDMERYPALRFELGMEQESNVMLRSALEIMVAEREKQALSR